MELIKMEKYQIIKLLGEKSRFDIFMKLVEFDELCVSELVELLNLRQSNISKHLMKFKSLNMLNFTRDGNIIKYSVKNDFITENTDLIKYLFM